MGKSISATVSLHAFTQVHTLEWIVFVAIDSENPRQRLVEMFEEFPVQLAFNPLD
jgi:hypothetical protein